MNLRIVIIMLILGGTALAADNASDKGPVHSITLPALKVALKPMPGMEQTAAYCNICHSLDYITTQPPFSAEKWEEIVNKMVNAFGAPIPPQIELEITGYLGSAYGKQYQ